MKTTMTAQQMRHRKFMLVLPLLALPFITMLFWALGGGKSTIKAAEVQQSGLNTSLPGAKIDSTIIDKMGIYQKTMQDSAKHKKAGEIIGIGENGPDAHEKMVSERLERLQQELNSPQEYPSGGGGRTKSSYQDAGSAEVARLERLMKNMQSGKEPDAEMQQLSDVLEKIQEIQNPGLAMAKLPKSTKLPETKFKAIPAMVARNQRAMQGSVIELVLLDSLVIGGQFIPKGHSIFGLAAFSNQRLNLEIKNIRLDNSIVPVDFTVFDKKDAMTGINAPEAMMTDAINSGSADAIGSIGMLGMSDNMGVQLAGAGIDAAKGLLNKRLKRIKQPLKKGYQVLLRDNSRQRP